MTIKITQTMAGWELIIDGSLIARYATEELVYRELNKRECLGQFDGHEISVNSPAETFKITL